MHPRDVWIVVAAFGEGPRLRGALEPLCASWPQVVVVDDGSSDETFAEAVKLPVWVLRHPVNCGQGAALQTGIDFALSKGAEVVVTFDADGQHDPADVEQLVEPVRAGRVQVALGSRFLGATVDMPRSRRLILKLGVLFTRVFSRIAVSDTHNGLRALSREAATKIRIQQDRMAHASDILDQIHVHRLAYCEVPVTIRYTTDSLEKGQGNWNAFRIVGQLILGRFVR